MNKKIIPINKIKWSIILEAHDDLSVFVQCIEKLIESVDPKRTEIILLGDQDNKILLDLFSKFCEKKNINYNYGDDREHSISLCQGMYVVFLSDHTIVSKNFLVRLTYCMENFDKESKTAIVGPISNQLSSDLNITPINLDAIQASIANRNMGWHYTLQLPLFCLMFRKELINPKLENIELVLQANLNGYFTVQANDTLVYHFPEMINTEMRSGIVCANEPQLAILYRIKLDDEYLRDIFIESLEKSLELTDFVYVLDDNSKVKLSIFLKESRPELWSKLKKYEKFSRPYDEKRDINQLMDWAEKDNCNWVFVLEGDEIIESRITRDYLKKLLNPVSQDVFAYKVSHYFFYNSNKQWRVDSPWGRMEDVRFARLLPGRRITKPGTCAFQYGYVADIPQESIRDTSIRVKNYGYIKPEYRLKKQEFYTKLNMPGLNFDHINNTNGMHRYEWLEGQTVTFYTPLKKGGDLLWGWLDKNAYFADEILIGDDEFSLSEDDKKIIESYPNARIVPTIMDSDYAVGRNKIINECKTTWIMQLDIDEVVEGLTGIRRVMDVPDVQGWMFTISNIQKDGGDLVTETIRLFKNKDGVKYWGRLHETIDGHVRERNWKVNKSPVRLTHYGYTLQTPEEAFHKMQKYLKINLQQMKENPMHGMSYYNVALHFLEDDLIDDAIKLLEICSFLQPGFPISALELCKTYILKARRWSDYTLKLLGHNHPLVQSFSDTHRVLVNISPKNHIVAKGHCLSYFNIHSDEREWLRKHIQDMERRVDEEKVKLMEKQTKKA